MKKETNNDLYKIIKFAEYLKNITEMSLIE